MNRGDIPSQLIELRGKCLASIILPQEALDSYFTLVRRVDTTKWWRDKRDSLIKDKCEQCGNDQPPFTLQHFWHPPTYQDLLAVYSYKLHGSKTDEKPQLEIIAELIAKQLTYLSMEGTQTFCRKCAYLWDRKGMKLCQKCKRHYHWFGYDSCFTCFETGIG